MIKDVFLTAAKFPSRSGVFKSFNLGAFVDPGYAALLKEIENLPPPLFPEISDFVFGADEEPIKKVIQTFSDYYLLVDFGDITSSKDDNSRIVDSFNISFTIARVVKDSDMDIAASTIIFDKCLSMAADIKRHLIKMSKPWCKDIEGNSTFSPFIAREMNSIGWSLIFDRQGLDLLNIKKATL